MRDAFVHGIRTPLHSYIIDVNTNRLIRIDDPKVYRMIVEGTEDRRLPRVADRRAQLLRAVRLSLLPRLYV